MTEQRSDTRTSDTDTESVQSDASSERRLSLLQTGTTPKGLAWMLKAIKIKYRRDYGRIQVGYLMDKDNYRVFPTAKHHVVQIIRRETHSSLCKPEDFKQADLLTLWCILKDDDVGLVGIQGLPESGKTQLGRYLTYEWATMEDKTIWTNVKECSACENTCSANDCQFLFLISSKYFEGKKDATIENYILDELLPENQREKDDALKSFMEFLSDGDGVLFVLDGYAKNDDLDKILNKKKFLMAKIIIVAEASILYNAPFAKDLVYTLEPFDEQRITQFFGTELSGVHMNDVHYFCQYDHLRKLMSTVKFLWHLKIQGLTEEQGKLCNTVEGFVNKIYSSEPEELNTLCEHAYNRLSNTQAQVQLGTKEDVASSLMHYCIEYLAARYMLPKGKDPVKNLNSKAALETVLAGLKSEFFETRTFLLFLCGFSSNCSILKSVLSYQTSCDLHDTHHFELKCIDEYEEDDLDKASEMPSEVCLNTETCNMSCYRAAQKLCKSKLLRKVTLQFSFGRLYITPLKEILSSDLEKCFVLSQMQEKATGTTYKSQNDAQAQLTKLLEEYSKYDVSEVCLIGCKNDVPEMKFKSVDKLFANVHECNEGLVNRLIPLVKSVVDLTGMEASRNLKTSNPQLIVPTSHIHHVQQYLSMRPGLHTVRIKRQMTTSTTDKQDAQQTVSEEIDLNAIIDVVLCKDPEYNVRFIFCLDGDDGDDCDDGDDGNADNGDDDSDAAADDVCLKECKNREGVSVGTSSAAATRTLAPLLKDHAGIRYVELCSEPMEEDSMVAVYDKLCGKITITRGKRDTDQAEGSQHTSTSTIELTALNPGSGSLYDDFVVLTAALQNSQTSHQYSHTKHTMITVNEMDTLMQACTMLVTHHQENTTTQCSLQRTDAGSLQVSVSEGFPLLEEVLQVFSSKLTSVVPSDSTPMEFTDTLKLPEACKENECLDKLKFGVTDCSDTFKCAWTGKALEVPTTSDDKKTLKVLELFGDEAEQLHVKDLISDKVDSQLCKQIQGMKTKLTIDKISVGTMRGSFKNKHLVASQCSVQELIVAVSMVSADGSHITLKATAVTGVQKDLTDLLNSLKPVQQADITTKQQEIIKFKTAEKLYIKATDSKLVTTAVSKLRNQHGRNFTQIHIENTKFPDTTVLKQHLKAPAFAGRLTLSGVSFNGSSVKLAGGSLTITKGTMSSAGDIIDLCLISESVDVVLQDVEESPACFSKLFATFPACDDATENQNAKTVKSFEFKTTENEQEKERNISDTVSDHLTISGMEYTTCLDVLSGSKRLKPASVECKDMMMTGDESAEIASAISEQPSIQHRVFRNVSVGQTNFTCVGGKFVSSNGSITNIHQACVLSGWASLTRVTATQAALAVEECGKLFEIMAQVPEVTINCRLPDEKTATIAPSASQSQNTKTISLEAFEDSALVARLVSQAKATVPNSTLLLDKVSLPKHDLKPDGELWKSLAAWKGALKCTAVKVDDAITWNFDKEKLSLEESDYVTLQFLIDVTKPGNAISSLAVDGGHIEPKDLPKMKKCVHDLNRDLKKKNKKAHLELTCLNVQVGSDTMQKLHFSDTGLLHVTRLPYDAAATAAEMCAPCRAGGITVVCDDVTIDDTCQERHTNRMAALTNCGDVTACTWKFSDAPEPHIDRLEITAGHNISAYGPAVNVPLMTTLVSATCGNTPAYLCDLSITDDHLMQLTGAAAKANSMLVLYNVAIGDGRCHFHKKTVNFTSCPINVIQSVYDNCETPDLVNITHTQAIQEGVYDALITTALGRGFNVHISAAAQSSVNFNASTKTLTVKKLSNIKAMTSMVTQLSSKSKVKLVVKECRCGEVPQSEVEKHAKSLDNENITVQELDVHYAVDQKDYRLRYTKGSYTHESDVIVPWHHHANVFHRPERAENTEPDSQTETSGGDVSVQNQDSTSPENRTNAQNVQDFSNTEVSTCDVVSTVLCAVLRHAEQPVVVKLSNVLAQNIGDAYQKYPDNIQKLEHSMDNDSENTERIVFEKGAINLHSTLSFDLLLSLWRALEGKMVSHVHVLSGKCSRLDISALHSYMLELKTSSENQNVVVDFSVKTLTIIDSATKSPEQNKSMSLLRDDEKSAKTLTVHRCNADEMNTILDLCCLHQKFHLVLHNAGIDLDVVTACSTSTHVLSTELNYDDNEIISMGYHLGDVKSTNAKSTTHLKPLMGHIKQVQAQTCVKLLAVKKFQYTEERTALDLISTLDGFAYKGLTLDVTADCGKTQSFTHSRGSVVVNSCSMDIVLPLATLASKMAEPSVVLHNVTYTQHQLAAVMQLAAAVTSNTDGYNSISWTKASRKTQSSGKPKPCDLVSYITNTQVVAGTTATTADAPLPAVHLTDLSYGTDDMDTLSDSLAGFQGQLTLSTDSKNTRFSANVTDDTVTLSECSSKLSVNLTTAGCRTPKQSVTIHNSYNQDEPSSPATRRVTRGHPRVQGVATAQQTAMTAEQYNSVADTVVRAAVETLTVTESRGEHTETLTYALSDQFLMSKGAWRSQTLCGFTEGFKKVESLQHFSLVDSKFSEEDVACVQNVLSTYCGDRSLQNVLLDASASLTCDKDEVFMNAGVPLVLAKLASQYIGHYGARRQLQIQENHHHQQQQQQQQTATGPACVSVTLASDDVPTESLKKLFEVRQFIRQCTSAEESTQSEVSWIESSKTVKTNKLTSSKNLTKMLQCASEDDTVETIDIKEIQCGEHDIVALCPLMKKVKRRHMLEWKHKHEQHGMQSCSMQPKNLDISGCSAEAALELLSVGCKNRPESVAITNVDLHNTHVARVMELCVGANVHCLTLRRNTTTGVEVTHIHLKMNHLLSSDAHNSSFIRHLLESFVAEKSKQSAATLLLEPVTLHLTNMKLRAEDLDELISCLFKCSCPLKLAEMSNEDTDDVCKRCFIRGADVVLSKHKAATAVSLIIMLAKYYETLTVELTDVPLDIDDWAQTAGVFNKIDVINCVRSSNDSVALSMRYQKLDNSLLMRCSSEAEENLSLVDFLIQLQALLQIDVPRFASTEACFLNFVEILLNRKFSGSLSFAELQPASGSVLLLAPEDSSENLQFTGCSGAVVLAVVKLTIQTGLYFENVQASGPMLTTVQFRELNELLGNEHCLQYTALPSDVKESLVDAVLTLNGTIVEVASPRTMAVLLQCTSVLPLTTCSSFKVTDTSKVEATELELQQWMKTFKTTFTGRHEIIVSTTNVANGTFGLFRKRLSMKQLSAETTLLSIATLAAIVTPLVICMVDVQLTNIQFMGILQQLAAIKRLHYHHSNGVCVHLVKSRGKVGVKLEGISDMEHMRAIIQRLRTSCLDMLCIKNCTYTKNELLNMTKALQLYDGHLYLQDVLVDSTSVSDRTLSSAINGEVDLPCVPETLLATYKASFQKRNRDREFLKKLRTLDINCEADTTAEYNPTVDTTSEFSDVASAYGGGSQALPVSSSTSDTIPCRHQAKVPRLHSTSGDVDDDDDDDDDVDNVDNGSMSSSSSHTHHLPRSRCGAANGAVAKHVARQMSLESAGKRSRDTSESRTTPSDLQGPKKKKKKKKKKKGKQTN